MPLQPRDPMAPNIEWFQTHSEALVIGHFPGLLRDEIKLAGTPTSITITIAGPEDRVQRDRMGYYATEVLKLYGYSETINFPFKINFQQAKATFKNNALEIRIPKA